MNALASSEDYKHRYLELPSRKDSFYRKVGALRGAYCVALLSPSNVRWLTGLDTGIALISEDHVELVVPKLEVERTREALPWVEVVEGPRRALWKVIRDRCKGPYLADLKYLNFNTAMKLIEELGAGDVSDKVAELRRRKDEYEIEVMRRALRVSERAFLKMWEELEEGMSELEGAGILEMHMREEGAQEFAFPTIAAFGENSAFPHHVPTETKFSRDKVALFDFGSVINGLRSDITRTWVPDSKSEWLHAVLEAINASLKVIRAGVKAKEVDAAAREALKEYGFEEAFVHGLGHGVGADIHEPPFVNSSSEEILVEGDVITVEPGVYFKGEGGVRVEQMVVVRKGGAEVLNSLPTTWS